jgi:hypothetical protein
MGQKSYTNAHMQYGHSLDIRMRDEIVSVPMRVPSGGLLSGSTRFGPGNAATKTWDLPSGVYSLVVYSLGIHNLVQ